MLRICCPLLRNYSLIPIDPSYISMVNVKNFPETPFLTEIHRINRYTQQKIIQLQYIYIS